jgi:hypothetical protein
VRSGLEVAANRGDARTVGVNLAIDAAAVLLLVAALWLVRQRVPGEDTPGDEEIDSRPGSERLRR